MPQFNDSENRPPAKIFAEGDYKFTVSDFEIGMQAGGKTSGSEKYEMELLIEGPDSIVYETLIDHKSTGWKIDCFLKSAGVKLAKGQAFSFRADDAQAQGVPWVNPLGLRGWCHIAPETYQPKSVPGAPAPALKTKMKVVTFYTDKEKLPADEKLRASVAAAEAAAQAQDDEDKPF